MNKWSQCTWVLPGRMHHIYSINVWFILRGKKITCSIVNTLKHSRSELRGVLFVSVYHTNTYFRGTSLKGTPDWCSPWYLSCRSILIDYEKKLWKQTAAYSVTSDSDLAAPMEFPQIHFFPVKKGGILQTSRIKTNVGDAKDTSQIQCQYHYSLAFYFL